MFKVFVMNLDTEEMHEAEFGSEEYFMGISLLVNDEDFDDTVDVYAYGNINHNLRYIIAKSEKEALKMYNLFINTNINQIESVLSAFCSGDNDSFEEELSELGDDYKSTLITTLDGSRHLEIEKVNNPRTDDEI